jgi:hypothetical protein
MFSRAKLSGKIAGTIADIRHGGEQVQINADGLSKLAEQLGAQVAQFKV